MPSPTEPDAFEPLFAYNKRLWLRVWIATQGAAIAVAIYTMVGRAGGLDAFLRSPTFARSVGFVALLVAYHVIGLFGHDWILRRPLAVVVFVPVGWLLILSTLRLQGAFGPLLLGAIIQ